MAALMLPINMPERLKSLAIGGIRIYGFKGQQPHYCKCVFNGLERLFPEKNRVAYQLDYFFKLEALVPEANTSIQMIASGPNSDREQIKLAFIKLITSAKKRVWIQTPYLVPDDSVLVALKVAAASGVDVKIMIPDKPDHPFIYRATQYYGRLLMKENIEILIYNGGFLHAKTMIMDDEVCTVGSANQDIRSYKLNFEANAVLYDKKSLIN